MIAVGPGLLDDGGDRQPLPVSPGDTVLYSKSTGLNFDGIDGSQYVVIRAYLLIAIVLPSDFSEA